MGLMHLYLAWTDYKLHTDNSAVLGFFLKDCMGPTNGAFNIIQNDLKETFYYGVYVFNYGTDLASHVGDICITFPRLFMAFILYTRSCLYDVHFLMSVHFRVS